MTRGRYYATVMPIAGILYALAIVFVHDGYKGSVTLIGAFAFALLGVIGAGAIGRS